ncbi:MAG: hypothetical protein ACRD3C_08495 [Vicinamibacterales bacterium]
MRRGPAPRRKELEAQLKTADEPPPLLHPEMAHVYRTKVTELAKSLQQPESRVEATEALRGLVDAIVLTPDGDREELGIELRGNLAAMLGATVQTKRSSESDDLSLQVSLVAGARNRQYRLTSRYRPTCPWWPRERHGDNDNSFMSELVDVRVTFIRPFRL